MNLTIFYIGTTRRCTNRRKQQVVSAEFAYQGAIQEQKLGLRSTFEVLNIERNLINARLSAALANTNIVLESARMLEITGELSAAF